MSATEQGIHAKVGTSRKPKRLREDSHCAKILRALKRARGAWVTMPRLVRLSGSYNVHSRVDELRARHGIAIENQTNLTRRPHVSKYRLVTS